MTDGNKYCGNSSGRLVYNIHTYITCVSLFPHRICMTKTRPIAKIKNVRNYINVYMLPIWSYIKVINIVILLVYFV